MTDSERIEALVKHSGLNIKRLAEEIGLKTVQTLYDIKNGKHGISKDVANKIKGKYLNINTQWLLTGEGDMFTSKVIQNNQNGDNIQGNSVTIHKSTQEMSGLIQALIDQLSTNQQQISKNQEQIDRLITIIETKL